MANSLLTAAQISRLAVGLLSRTLVLPNTVASVPGTEFSGSNGDTVTVRVPQPATSREQATPATEITFDDITETSVDVTVAHHYHANLVSDEDLSMNLVDFGQQITSVQIDAVARTAEDELATAMNDHPTDITGVDDTNVAANVLAARTTLGENDVPAGDRFLAVAPDFAELLLGLDNLSFADRAADDSALREATIGRYRGFTVVESNALDAGTAVAYHRSGFAFANRVPVPPRSGSADSATASLGGVGLRTIIQYMPQYLSDASVVSVFAGATLIDADRVVKLDTTSTA